MTTNRRCEEFAIPESMRDTSLAHKLYENAYSDIYANAQPEVPVKQGTVELLKLRNRTADHAGADALVYFPPGFDPNKPIRLVVYNHGLDMNVSEAFRYSKLKEQIDQAGSNTVLVMPEWQVKAGTRNGYAGRFTQNGFFSKMLEEIMQKTPQLQGNTLNDVESISVFTHSGGYNAAASEIYKNGLGDKVTSVTLLDSLYSGALFDKWIQDNICDLAQGRKHFNNIFGASTYENSKAAAQRVERMLRQAGLPGSSIVEDFDGRTVMRSPQLAGSGIVFKHSNVRVPGRSAHYSVTNIYPGEVLLAENYYAQNNRIAALQRWTAPFG